MKVIMLQANKLITILGACSNQQRCFYKWSRKRTVLWWRTYCWRYRLRGLDDRSCRQRWWMWRRCWCIWLSTRSWWSIQRWNDWKAQGLITLKRARIKMTCSPSFRFHLNYLHASSKLMSHTYLWCLAISPISKMKVKQLKYKTKSTVAYSRSSLSN